MVSKAGGNGMKRYGFGAIGAWCLVVLAVALMARGAEAAIQTHLEGAYDNLYSGGTPPEGATVIAGGNAGPYPAPADSVPKTAAGDVVLQRSAFGAMTGGKMAFPNVVGHLEGVAEGLMVTGTEYKSTLGQNGTESAAWDIRFPGVRAKESGEKLVAGANGEVSGQNYFDSDILAAAERYRSILRINPYHVGAAEGLLTTYYERMVPLIFAGNNAHVWAFRSRVVEASLAYEIGLMEEGIDFYEGAVNVFASLNDQLPDSLYLDGTAPLIDHDVLRLPDADPIMAIVPKLVETYIRAIAYQGEAAARRVDLSYLDVYDYPVLPIESAADRREIVDYIDGKAGLMEHELLLANAYLDVFTQTDGVAATDIGRASQVVAELLGAKTRIEDGHVSFAISRGADGGVTPDSYGVYAPEFVPFLYRGPDGLINFPNSYQNFYNRAVEIVSRARAWEEEARHEDRDFDNNQAELGIRLNAIRGQYESELTTLCGQIRDGNGNLVPDIPFCLFPQKERMEKYPYNQPGETPEGAIYSQWRRIYEAETEVDAAMMELENLVKRMAKKEEIATKIADGIENIATLMLSNGDKLAALEMQKGELSSRQIGYENRQRQNAGVWSSIASIAQSVNDMFSSPQPPDPQPPEEPSSQKKRFEPITTAIAIGSAIASHISSAEAAEAIAKKNAETQRALARINAQMQRIQAFQSAQIQFQRRDEVLYRTEEELHSMILQAERLKLNILMAEQRADMEQAELARLHGRVAFLLQESSRAYQLIAQNPINRPDYRLIRDLKMRDADEMFAYAQERCFLAAKAAEYRVNPSPNNLSHPVYQTIEAIMTARRANNLISVLDALNDQIETLYINRGATTTDSRFFSVRNDIIQNNDIDENNPANNKYELQVDAYGNLITSDEAWQAFLSDHFVYDPAINADKLEFAFSTSLNRSMKGNALHIPNTLGMLISWTGDNRSQQNGVTINIRGRGLSLADRVRINLRQEGASSIRYNTWDYDNSANAVSIRVWNLDPVTANVIAAVNGSVKDTLPGDGYRPSTPQFHERSPANDRWVFTIREDMGGANDDLLAQLDQITDIEITFDVTYFTP